MRKLILIMLSLCLMLVACRSGAGVEVVPDIAPTETAVAETVEDTPPSPGEKAAELVEAGRSLLENDNCEAALEPLKQAVELDPESTDAYLVLGNAFPRAVG